MIPRYHPNSGICRHSSALFGSGVNFTEMRCQNISSCLFLSVTRQIGYFFHQRWPLSYHPFLIL